MICCRSASCDVRRVFRASTSASKTAILEFSPVGVDCVGFIGWDVGEGGGTVVDVIVVLGMIVGSTGGSVVYCGGDGGC